MPPAGPKKNRFTALDARATVEELQLLVGQRLNNVYDIPPRMFVFKFGQGDKKRVVLLENGIRFHVTRLVREIPKVPSQFTFKLRKHILSWRLHSVTQPQNDRTIDMKFGTEDKSYHVIVELFGKGNVILTDHEYRIMMLLRTHKDDDVKIFVRELYPIVPTGNTDTITSSSTDAQVEKDLQQELRRVLDGAQPHDWVVALLSGIRHLGPALALHAVTVCNIPDVKLAKLGMRTDDLAETLLPGLLSAYRIGNKALPGGGYLVSHQNTAGKGKESQKQQKQEQEKETASGAGGNNAAGTTDGPSTVVVAPTEVVVYDDFTPVLLSQHTNKWDNGAGTMSAATATAGAADGVTIQRRENFGDVVDDFFLHTEVEKIDLHNEKKVSAKLSKRERFERDHNRRISALENEEEGNRHKGEMIILNADKVNDAINLINGALASGIQWVMLHGVLKRRRAEGHPVAYMINELHLERNSISVMLEQDDLYDDEDDNDVQPLVVEVELDKTAHANATQYFTKKKANRSKLEKTIAATTKAIAGAENAGKRASVRQGTVKKEIRRERIRQWWEKFNFFRTSAGDLVLQGKDVGSTEILVRRMMRLGDIFVSSDEDKSLPCVLRPAASAAAAAAAAASNRTQGEDEGESYSPCSVPLCSLEEAGMWCVSRSGAWDAKRTVSAWWIHASQLTGGFASGTYLFDGEKQYMRPMPLAMGVGLLFRVQRRVAVETEFSFWTDVEKEKNQKQEEKEEAPSMDHLFIAADTASALHELPPLQQPQRAKKPPLPTQNQNQNQKRKEDAADERSVSSITTATTTTTISTATTMNNSQALTKHQKRKMKKIKNKYADQDEEDRMLGAMLNGNRLAKVQVQALQREEGEDGEDEEAEDEVEKQQDQHGSAGDEDEGEDVSAEKGEGFEVEVDGEDKDTTELQTTKKKGKWDNRTNSQQQEQQQFQVAAIQMPLEEFFFYTSNPLPDDKVEYVVPVSAPSSTLISYRYRVELVFGAAKKGQVADAILGHFLAVAASNKVSIPASTSATPAAAEDRSSPPQPAPRCVEFPSINVLLSNDIIEQLRGNVKPLNTQRYDGPMAGGTSKGTTAAAAAAAGGGAAGSNGQKGKKKADDKGKGKK